MSDSLPPDTSGIPSALPVPTTPPPTITMSKLSSDNLRQASARRSGPRTDRDLVVGMGAPSGAVRGFRPVADDSTREADVSTRTRT